MVTRLQSLHGDRQVEMCLALYAQFLGGRGMLNH